MNALAGKARPESLVSLALAAAASCAILASGLTDSPFAPVTAFAFLVAAALTAVNRVEWSILVGAIILVILFIPIRRYILPGSLPFALEPYRLVVALVFAAWFASLLIDPRVRLRRTLLDGPLVLVCGAMLGSLAANTARASSLQADVLKSVTFFASFVLLVYLIASVVRTERRAEFLLKVLVAGGTIVALLAIVEYQSGVNIFDRVMSRLPFVRPSVEVELARSEGVHRAFASAEHPIALGAMLAMLIPIAFYVARTSSRRIWWLAAAVLLFGLLATVSRTSILMLVAATVVVFVVRPGEIKRLLPLLVVAILVSKVVVPGSVGTLRYFFFPPEGLIAQQKSSEGSCTSAGRIADLGPSLSEVARKPTLGYGFGTRLVTGERANACILDNQWLGTLLETGFVGALAFLWLFWRFIRRLAREGRRDLSPRGWLPTALASAVAAYAAGMLTFDAFGFIQVTVLMFILLGIGAAVMAERRPVELAAI